MRNKHDDVKKALDDINRNVDCLIGNIMFLVDNDNTTKEEFDEEMEYYLKINHDIRDLTKLIGLIVDIMEVDNKIAENKLKLIKELLNKVQ